MDPITASLVAALTAGVAGGATEVGKNLIKDAYQAVTAALRQKFGVDSDLTEAVTALEKKPDSQGRAATVAEEMVATGAAQDPELLKLVETLQAALKSSGASSSYQATLSGTGAMAQGENATAVSSSGTGNITIGSVGGSVALPGKDDDK